MQQQGAMDGRDIYVKNHVIFEIISYAYAFFLNVHKYWMQHKHFICSHSQIRVHNYFIWWSKEIWWKRFPRNCDNIQKPWTMDQRPPFLWFLYHDHFVIILDALCTQPPPLKYIFILQKFFDLFRWYIFSTLMHNVGTTDGR